ncbi:hypothetical protein PspLS_03460 [Pyricularia sp. CBS 133598]|nr:hypothetical protein PspLS_03460 [Pyricularia sp. CBS 133598]
MYIPVFMEIQTATATDNRGPRLTAVIITLTSISSLFVSLRLYTRAIIKKSLYPEDYVIVLALLMSWGEAAFHIVAVRYGLGRHMWELTPVERQGAQLWSIFASVSGIFGLGLPKIALAMMLNRVLLANYCTSMVSWFLSIMSMVNFTVANFMILFQCTTPKQAAWVHDPDDAKCYNIWLVIAICIYASVFSAFGDLYFVCGRSRKVFAAVCRDEGEDLITWKVPLLSAESSALLISSSIPFLTPIGRILARWFKGAKALARDGEMDSAPDLVHNLGHDRRLNRRGWDTESAIVLRNAPRHRQRSIRPPVPFGIDDARGGPQDPAMGRQWVSGG